MRERETMIEQKARDKNMLGEVEGKGGGAAGFVLGGESTYF